MLATNYPSRKIGSTVDYEAIKRHGWHDQGIIVASVYDNRLNDWERQFLRNIGAKLFGSKKLGAAAR